MALEIEIPATLEKKIENEAEKRGDTVAHFVVLLISLLAMPYLLKSEDAVVRDLAEEIGLYLQQEALGSQTLSNKALDLMPSLLPDSERSQRAADLYVRAMAPTPEKVVELLRQPHTPEEKAELFLLWTTGHDPERPPIPDDLLTREGLYSDPGSEAA